MGDFLLLKVEELFKLYILKQMHFIAKWITKAYWRTIHQKWAGAPLRNTTSIQSAFNKDQIEYYF